MLKLLANGPVTSQIIPVTRTVLNDVTVANPCFILYDLICSAGNHSNFNAYINFMSC